MPIFKLFLPKVISDLFMKNIFYDLCCTIPVFSCFVSSVRTNRVSCLANTKVSCKARVHNFKVIFSSQQYSIKEAKMKQMSLLHLKWSKLACFKTRYGYTSLHTGTGIYSEKFFILHTSVVCSKSASLCHQTSVEWKTRPLSHVCWVLVLRNTKWPQTGISSQISHAAPRPCISAKSEDGNDRGCRTCRKTNRCVFHK